LSGHFLKLLENTISRIDGYYEGYKGKDDAPVSISHRYPLKRAKLIILNHPNGQRRVAVLYFCASLFVLRIGADILLDCGWSRRIDGGYRRWSGRSLTDRERVCIACGCTIVAVALSFHALILLSDGGNVSRKPLNVVGPSRQTVMRLTFSRKYPLGSRSKIRGVKRCGEIWRDLQEFGAFFFWRRS
jgi:hypothetical protein